ncbi:diguanylate cyclase (GGDEF) domain-containing protein [Pseudogulbenkiania subflava DSM 22618]|uniref:Diguanylate cyclase (GGDEF) domain-containing protein n=2 Tax=Pseudogulbenkiania subflava TaxID=451637 RepID=A0A1Y6B704_9NEIS|nr:diguanylate cyclase (GGDEF) domain-containing protein [Pseudogulbenkiania subflava DSM 22618]
MPDIPADTYYDNDMNSTVDYLYAPQAAAEAALALLGVHQRPLQVAVWAKVGTVWQCLAWRGAVDGLVSPDELQRGRLPGPDGGAEPLKSGSELLGWLIWRGPRPDNWSPVALLLTGHLLAARLHSDQAISRITHETMLEMSRLASECASLEAFLPGLHRLLGRLLDARNFYIALLDEQANALSFPLYADLREPASEWPQPEQRFPMGGQPPSLTAYLMAGGKPLVLSRRMLETLQQNGDIQIHGPIPESWMGVPLNNIAGQPIGAAALQSYQAGHSYSPTEQSLFQFVALHIGHVLARVMVRNQLEQQVWLRTCELEGANTRLRNEVAERQLAEKRQGVLFLIAELSNTSLSLEAFLGGVHRLLGELLPARNCLVALYDKDHDLISFPYYQDERCPSHKARKPGKGYIEQVLYSGQALQVNSSRASGDDATLPRSWLGVPLYHGHELLGVLAVQSYDEQVQYGFREQELLEFVANNIGAALARIHAMEALQAAYLELEERVRERTSELDAANAQLEFDSLHDPLTKLPNRTYFARALRRSWEAYVNGSGERFAVLFIDLDRFKLVNDTLGHLAGDHLLFEAGARIRSCLRHSDFVARLGGDEFAALLFGIEAPGCEQTARMIVGEFDRPVVLMGREVFTTASVGVVIADKSYYQRSEDVLRDADHAMYRTKQQGRHGYTLFNHELRLNQADQLALESELRRALEVDDQLTPFFQPFIDAKSGALQGFEALVRWQHPTRGLISPAIFLPMAEESGLIMRVDRYMIEAAARQLRQWMDEGRLTDGVSLHINLSSANFHDPELLNWMQALIRRYALPAGMLHLEVTESALIDVPDVAAEVIQGLHNMGVRLALDDFGTGYSALSYLHRYHFDVLKIDQSFVADLDQKQESAAIVRAILALAEALDLDVVAEGVETGMQLRTLRDMGCSKLQGFYFATPAPAARIDWDRLAGFASSFRQVA